MPRYYLICIFLSVPLFINGQHVADSLFAAGDYLAARVEFERMVFAAAHPREAQFALLRKSQCFKAQGDFANAYQTLQRIAEDENNTQLKAAITYEKAFAAFLNNKSDVALGHLQEWQYYFPDTTVQILKVIEILSLNDLHRWSEAQEKFSAYAKTFQPILDSSIYEEMLNYKPRHPAKAELLSMLLPGLGQMYAGSFLRGLTSTAVNGSFVLFAIYNFTNGFILSGAFTGVALFYIFYTGGASYARSLAEKKNEEVYAGFNNRIRNQLLAEVQKK